MAINIKTYQLAWLVVSLIMLQPITLSAQFSIEVGGSVVPELSIGGGFSDYNYNGINAGFRDWRLGIRETNLLTTFRLPKGFNVNSRLLLIRRYGAELNRLTFARLNLEYQPSNKLSFKLGRVMIPFGNFYDRPLPQDRLLITAPLGYLSYTNISNQVGYTSNLYEPQILEVDGQLDYGIPLLYELGYGNGFRLDWDIKPDTFEVDLAVLMASPSHRANRSSPIHPTVVLRTEFRPTYFWKHGFSASYGGFMQSNSLNEELDLSRYKQLIVGTHAILGYTYFEIKGEVMASLFQVPQFLSDSTGFLLDDNHDVQRQNLSSISAYADAKVEMPFWPGAYVVYRYEFLGFQSPGNDPILSDWDDNVVRHSIGIGFEISRNILFKSAVAVQDVQNRNWDLRQWRSSLILFF